MFASCQTCIGDCCEHIYFQGIFFWMIEPSLNFEYQKQHELALRHARKYVQQYRLSLNGYEGIEFIDFAPEDFTNILKLFNIYPREDRAGYYCKYHDLTTGKCSIYKKRPSFCRLAHCDYEHYKRNNWR